MRIVIAGASEAGVELARVLSTEGNEVVLLDRNPQLLQEAEEHLDVIPTSNIFSRYRLERRSSRL